MHSALHANDGNIADIPNYELTGVTNRGRLREMRDLLVRNARRVGKFIGKCAETRPENERDLRSKLRLRQNEFRRACRLFEFARCGFRLRSHVHSDQAQEKIPTIEAEIRFAIVPAIIALMPNFANWLRCSGASAPMPPI